jgi:hypothetical protein
MIELTSAVILLVSSLYGGTTVAVAQDVTDSANTQSQAAIEKPVTLSKYVEDYFAETPILAKIAMCESTLRQVDKDGQVLRGKVNKDDVGLLQINEFYHGDKAESLGLDLETINGNLAYAKYLYEKEGTAPWSASAKCWSK